MVEKTIGLVEPRNPDGNTKGASVMATTHFDVDWKSIPTDKLMEQKKLMDEQMFQKMYMQNPVPLSEERRDGRYRLSDAEHWMLQSYAIQFMGQEQDEFFIGFEYPERIPLEYMLQRGVYLESKRGTDTYAVWSVNDENGCVGNITTLIGFWDERQRIRWMRHEDEEEKMDPADVLSDSDEKWVHVVETRNGDKSDYQSERSLRTTYEGADGQALDTRQQNSLLHANRHASYSDRTHWREERRYHADYESYRYHNDPSKAFTPPVTRTTTFMTRESLDRAHADEMMGPARSDKRKG